MTNLGQKRLDVALAIAGSLSGLFGVAWAIYCDRLYAQRQPQSTI